MIGSDDNPTRDERAQRYALGLRDLTRGTPIEPTAQRVIVLDDVSRAALPAPSPIVGFRFVRAAGGAGVFSGGQLLAGSRGFVVEAIETASALLICDTAVTFTPLVGPVAIASGFQLPRTLPGRMDPNSGFAFAGRVFGTGTGTPADATALIGTVNAGHPVLNGARFSFAGGGWYANGLNWVLEPNVGIQLVNAVSNAAADFSIYGRVPLIPSPLA